MKKRVNRISILQSAKMTTAMYAIFGFIYALIGIPMLLFGGQQTKIIAIVYLCMPVLMAVLGFIFFVIFASIYNLLAKWLGGFEFEVADAPQTTR